MLLNILLLRSKKYPRILSLKNQLYGRIYVLLGFPKKEGDIDFKYFRNQAFLMENPVGYIANRYIPP